jgi:hypothetical protein
MSTSITMSEITSRATAGFTAEVRPGWRLGIRGCSRRTRRSRAAEQHGPGQTKAPGHPDTRRTRHLCTRVRDPLSETNRHDGNHAIPPSSRPSSQTKQVFGPGLPPRCPPPAARCANDKAPIVGRETAMTSQARKRQSFQAGVPSAAGSAPRPKLPTSSPRSAEAHPVSMK